jgi:hypothetical protein
MLHGGVLGVGGVGKTTYIYRLVGVPIQPKTTLRPGMYRTTIRELPVCILDVPGHRAIEVADALARAWPYYLDLAIYMYDVTDAYTLQSLLDIEQHLRSKVVKPYCGCVVVGNKVDLAKERHTFITAEDVAEALGGAWRLLYLRPKRPLRQTYTTTKNKSRGETCQMLLGAYTTWRDTALRGVHRHGRPHEAGRARRRKSEEPWRFISPEMQGTARRGRGSSPKSS